MMEVKSVLEKLNLSGASAVPFSSEEDGNLYDVYKIQFDDQTFVLKKHLSGKWMSIRNY